MERCLKRCKKRRKHFDLWCKRAKYRSLYHLAASHWVGYRILIFNENLRDKNTNETELQHWDLSRKKKKRRKEGKKMKLRKDHSSIPGLYFHVTD